MYPATINVFSKNKKNIRNFHLKINMFTAVKFCCILHGRVCVLMLQKFLLQIDMRFFDQLSHSIYDEIWINDTDILSLGVRQLTVKNSQVYKQVSLVND